MHPDLFPRSSRSRPAARPISDLVGAVEPARPAATLAEEVERYWRSLAGPGTAPTRAELDPGRIDAALAYAFILEFEADGVARMRVAGGALSRWLGDEARGQALSVLFERKERARLEAHVAVMWTQPALVDLPVVAKDGSGGRGLIGRMLLLPLLDESGAATRALGAILVDGAAREARRSFTLGSERDVRVEPVRREAGRASKTLQRPEQVRSPVLAGLVATPTRRRFAAPKPPVASGAQGTDAPRGHLRLVASQD